MITVDRLAQTEKRLRISVKPFLVALSPAVLLASNLEPADLPVMLGDLCFELLCQIAARVGAAS